MWGPVQAVLLCCAVQGTEVPEEFVARPGSAVADRFHPDGQSREEPRRGGQVTVHVAALPPHLNYLLVGRSSLRHVLEELHESLVRRDLDTWEWRGVLAERWDVEDRLVLQGGVADVCGRVEVQGDDYVVTPLSPRVTGDPLSGGEPLRVPRANVARLDRGTVYTFHLRDDVRWHDGHPFDAGDVLFAFRCARSPHVGAARGHRFEKLARAEAVGSHAVRFVFERPYFLALSTFDSNLTLLPAHVFDRTDPDHPDHAPDIDPEAWARHVVEHPANREWIGLGPYRLAGWTADGIDAERFDDYFDPDRAGFVDRIRWRAVRGATATQTALLSGELDFTARLGTEAFFGEFTELPRFEERLYRGHYFLPYMGYVAWNTQRPALADARVRRALGMSFDWSPYVASLYRGLAFRVTGEQFVGGPNYDRELEPLPFDLDGAAGLLTAAGWYDRDGDGVVDRDGRPLALEYLLPTGNSVSKRFGLALQERLARIGVRLDLLELETTALRERLDQRTFDAVSLGLALDFESDPEQLWHSRWSEVASGNRSGLADEEVDELIEAIQSELDDAARARLFRRLQRRLYELQPYMFGVCVARRFALARRVRNFEIFALDPGYSIRRWWVDE